MADETPADILWMMGRIAEGQHGGLNIAISVALVAALAIVVILINWPARR